MRRPVALAALLVVALPLGVASGAGPARAQQPGAGGPGGGESPAGFWEAIGEPALARLVETALRSNPELRAVDATAAGARAVRTDAALGLAPVVTASTGYHRQRVPRLAAGPGAPSGALEEDRWDAGVQLAWELDVFGRGRNALQGRSALVASADASVRDTEVRLAAALAEAYFRLRGSGERLEVARRNAENQRRTLQLTRDRLEAGTGSALDAERAEVQLSSTLATIPALEAELVALRQRIATLTGRPPEAFVAELGDERGGGVDPERAARVLPAPPRSADLEARVRERSDLRAAERRLAASRAFTAAARADYLPRVSIAGAAGYTASEFRGLGDPGTPRYAIGPVVSWPLFDLGRVRAGVDAARAQEAESAALLRAATARATEELHASLQEYGSARERLQHLEQAAAASERATELARLRFEEGATGFLEVLDAERTQLDAQDRLAAGRTAATVGMVAVFRALGGRWLPGDDVAAAH